VWGDFERVGSPPFFSTHFFFLDSTFLLRGPAVALIAEKPDLPFVGDAELPERGPPATLAVLEGSPFFPQKSHASEHYFRTPPLLVRSRSIRF